MKVLVLGGSGFIGANVARAARAAGHDVRVYTRGRTPPLALDGCAVEYVQGDMRDTPALQRVLDGCDALVHCAGAYPTRGTRARAQVDAARADIRAVLTAAARARVARVVYTSSYATIGPPPPGESRRSDERDTWAPGQAGHAYFDMKLAQEDEALRFARDGLHVVLLLPTACFGPYDARPTSGAAFVQFARFRPPFYFRGTINAIDVRDVAEAHVAALARGRSAERYIIGHDDVPFVALSRWIAESVGVVPPRIGLPAGPIHAIGRALEAVGCAPEFLTGSMRLIQRAVPLNCSKAARELHAPVRSVRDAVADEAEWLRAHGYIA